MPRLALLSSLALAVALAAPAAVQAADEPALTSPVALDPDAAAAAAFDAQAAAEAAKLAASTPRVPTLRSTAVVDGPYVRLSDLFDGVPAKIDTVVAPAPRAGEQSVYTVDWLEATARRHGLEWKPASRFEQATVVRDSQVVGRSEIIAALRPHLADQGMPPQADIVLTARDNSVSIPAGAVNAVGVLDTTYDAVTQRFNAVIEIPAGTPNAMRLSLSGRVHLTTAVPVLVTSMRQGETIGPRDIDWVTVRVDQLKRDTITDPEQLIGRTPRRLVQAGAPVQSFEVDRPRLVSKGAMVTMIYYTPYMQLTAQGRALEHGSKGDQVRIQNLQSNQTVTGIVADQNLVTVQIGPSGPLR
ncbi:flagellar basal body P-ring formation chaperone FlgA [Caenispirillum bisanense]|uniref:Flagella basal body P-ring formation protein FlgA n=1 Tax=Caenispirillum bisanense TaxID=414052 RepID=A0A286GX85_9PROT|nr:flagellar basal body P-ring formation chaperone FlgA [Caenispirillum bisanense]SOE00155.1 flagella basal body P-ring formation protein FlgA [Caenispirillum bisanense]